MTSLRNYHIVSDWVVAVVQHWIVPTDQSIPAVAAEVVVVEEVNYSSLVHVMKIHHHHHHYC